MDHIVFEWSEGSDANTCFKEALSFLKEKEKGYRERLIDEWSLKEVVEAALTQPEGGWRYLSGGGVARRYRWRATTSLLGCAWVGIGEARFLALSYERPGVSGYDLPLYALRYAADMAGWSLEGHLADKGLKAPERVERIGGVLLGGFSFQTRPKWIAPAESPELRVQIRLYRLVWDDLRRLKPQSLSKHIAEALKESRVEVKASLIAKALEGKRPLSEGLGLSLLSKL